MEKEEVKIDPEKPKTRTFVGCFTENEKIIIVNPKKVIDLVRNIKQMGIDNLNILTDFDFTLTKRIFGEKTADSTFAVIAKSEFVSDTYKKTSIVNFEKYSPLEKDPNIETTKKHEIMEEWWLADQAALIKEKYHKEAIEQSVIHSKLYLRHGIIELFDIVKKYLLPIYIVTAGIGAIAKSVLRLMKHPIFVPQIEDYVQVVCSKELYDEEHCICGFQKPLVTSMTKQMVLNYEHYPNLRKNAILMGDIIDDITMAENIKHENLLTVGFLNSTKEDKAKELTYATAFDIVIANDGNLLFINELLEFIAQPIVEKEQEAIKLTELFDKYGIQF